MNNVTHYPLLIFVIFFIALWLASFVGRLVLRGRHTPDSELREDFGTILTAVLTLLGLIIAFSFSMATTSMTTGRILRKAKQTPLGRNMSGPTGCRRSRPGA